MNFDLSKEQIHLIDTLKKFTEKEIEPQAREMDEQGAVPNELVSKMSVLTAGSV